MRALHKVVATGAFGGLAAAAVVGSGAFACTPAAGVTISTAGTSIAPATVQAGDKVDVLIRSFFDPAGGNAGLVTVTWMEDPTGTPVTVTSQPGPSFTVRMTIPDGVKPATQYDVVATQIDGSGVPMKSASSSVFTARGAEVSNPAPTAPVPAPTPQPSVESPTAAPADTSTPPVVSSPAATPTPSAAAPAAPKAVAPSAPAATGTRAAAPSATGSPVVAPVAPKAAQPTASPTTPSAEILPAAPVSQPAASDLWSGLNANRTPSLLDAAAPAAPRSGLPVGSLLLGGGVLALAGTVLAAGRRRLAVSRITRR